MLHHTVKGEGKVVPVL